MHITEIIGIMLVYRVVLKCMSWWSFEVYENLSYPTLNGDWKKCLIRKFLDYRVTHNILTIVSVPHTTVGLERMWDCGGVGLQRFHCSQYCIGSMRLIPCIHVCIYYSESCPQRLFKIVVGVEDGPYAKVY